jgi:dihydrofolate reductase
LVGSVVAQMSMSLDGFIADPADGVEEMFGWYGNGPVEFTCPDPRWMFRVSEASAELLREGFAGGGRAALRAAAVRAHPSMGGNHPLGVPVFVVTHAVPDGWPQADKPFTFVTDGIASAVERARAAAGDRKVAGSGSSTT